MNSLGPSWIEPVFGPGKHPIERIVERAQNMLKHIRKDTNMSVRAKFKVDAIERTQAARYPHKNANGQVDYHRPETVELNTIKMSPVYGNGNPNHENTKFWEASPTGSLTLGTVNAAAAATFELGKEYYIDFTPATAEPAQ